MHELVCVNHAVQGIFCKKGNYKWIRTLKSIQEYVAPKYQIRWYMDSLGSDTLAFCIGLTAKWEQLEQEFGTEKVVYYFTPIHKDTVMFEMDMNEVFDLIEQRENNKEICGSLSNGKLYEELL